MREREPTKAIDSFYHLNCPDTKLRSGVDLSKINLAVRAQRKGVVRNLHGRCESVE